MPLAHRRPAHSAQLSNVNPNRIRATSTDASRNRPSLCVDIDVENTRVTILPSVSKACSSVHSLNFQKKSVGKPSLRSTR